MSDNSRPAASETADRKMTGLDADAYLNAEALFRKTGDLRYLVLVIGKPRASSYSSDPLEVPEWALAECREYAAKIMNATDQQRKNIVTSFADPIPYNTVRDSFTRTMDVFLDLSGDELTFSEAARRAEAQKAKEERRPPKDDPDQVRTLRKFQAEETRELRPCEEDKPVRSRRVEEKLMNRVAKRRRATS